MCFDTSAEHVLSHSWLHVFIHCIHHLRPTIYSYIHRLNGLCKFQRNRLRLQINCLPFNWLSLPVCRLFDEVKSMLVLPVFIQWYAKNTFIKSTQQSIDDDGPIWSDVACEIICNKVFPLAIRFSVLIPARSTTGCHNNGKRITFIMIPVADTIQFNGCLSLRTVDL